MQLKSQSQLLLKNKKKEATSKLMTFSSNLTKTLRRQTSQCLWNWRKSFPFCIPTLSQLRESPKWTFTLTLLFS